MLTNYTTPIQLNAQNIYSANPTKNPLSIPVLPNYVEFDPNLGLRTGIWIDQYIEYANAISPMTPKLFHESAALWLLSVAVARRVVLKMDFADVYPNLYILWVAPSTLYKKSTSLEIATGIALDVFPFLLAPNDTTPEAMISDMAGREPSLINTMTEEEKILWEKERPFCAQRGWVQDEFSGLMAAMNRDYNAGLLEAYLRFYDCKKSYTRSTKSQGRITIKNSYLSLLCASTPSALSFYFGNEKLWTNGFWPRFAILTPENETQIWIEPRNHNYPCELINQLSQIFDKLPSPKWPNSSEPLSVQLGRGVFDLWNRYNKAVSFDLLSPELDSRLYASYGRFPSHALKISILLSMMDWENNESPVIEVTHLTRAIQITESWRESVHRALSNVLNERYEHLRKRITSVLSQNYLYGFSFRDICRAMRDLKPHEILNTLQEMVSSGDVILETKPSGSKGGRPSDIYRLSKE